MKLDKKKFFEILERSGCIGPKAGQAPVYFQDSESGNTLFSFIKTHSYGEYIFDWEWARAFESHKLAYYPKLTSMIPYTSASTSHFLNDEFNEVSAKRSLDSFEVFYRKGNYSSAHFLFLLKEEIPFFKSSGYLIRESMQYHFFNDGYQDFEDFLSSLKTKKAKNLRKERLFPTLSIQSFTNDELNEDFGKEMYQLYLSTIDLKNSIAYLTESFFTLLFQEMKENILYVRATEGEKLVAGSLFFYDSERLYGRYWGSHTYIPNLHYELCYYQGIDFCLKKGFKVFEAGAQGEHKIARGFRPIRIYSAHKIKHPGFHEAIANFIEQEKRYIAQAIQELSTQLPFKSELQKS